MRRAVVITLTEQEHRTLTAWSRSRTLPARQTARAKIVLLATAGKTHPQLAAELAIERTVVGRWRTRFAAQRLGGIAQERGGRGRKPTKRRRWARTIVQTTLHAPPKNATHWSTRTLADHLGIDKSMVERV